MSFYYNRGRGGLFDECVERYDSGVCDRHIEKHGGRSRDDNDDCEDYSNRVVDFATY